MAASASNLVLQMLHVANSLISKNATVVLMLQYFLDVCVCVCSNEKHAVLHITVKTMRPLLSKT